MKKALLPILLILVLISCSRRGSYEKLSDGVTVTFSKDDELKKIRLQVISDKIIRVTATPTDSFAIAESLMIVSGLKSSANWTLDEAEDEIILKTSAIKASVSLLTGEVIFRDTTGKIILQEKQGGGKSFSAITVDSEKMYQLSQQFESPADEAFYGLGQHQEGLMNYKGQDVSLFQYNTKVAVPFLVSNKNYGILWDNYSLTKFGNKDEYKPLSQLKLYSVTGEEGGLTGKYISKYDSSKVYLSRIDTMFSYEYLPDQKKFPEEFPLQDGKVIWEGTIGSQSEGVHKFSLYYAGYIKIWLNNKQVADHWRQAWNPGTVKFDLEMKPNTRYPIRIEWIPDGGESYISLKWANNKPEDQTRLSLFSEAGDQIDYYFIAGDNMDEVISGYRTLTGKAEILPKWALGFWQSRERYKTQKELIDVVKEFRTRQIPLDNIVLDWSYWEQDKWGSQDFDLTRFPDAEGMIKDLHEKYHTRFMISVWPKFYEGIDSYKAFDQKGWLYKVNINNRQRDWIGKGYVSTFYDAFSPEARDAFWKLIHDKLYVIGVDGWWLDSTEPDILSNASIDHRKQLMNPTALGPSTKYFNAYALMNERGVYEGLRRTDPDERVFIFTRSAYAGSQRFSSATWSGDIAANWQDFKTQIPAGLNFSLSGIPYWTTDIGGFSVERKYENAQGEDLEEWRERMTRWFQFGTFNPIFRVHGQYPFREMFNVAPDNHPAYNTMVYYDKLRYRLFPYIYSLAGKSYFDDYTIMRALVMDFPSDENVINIGTEFMFGPSLLVAPVTEYKARKWSVYLPQGAGWYSLHDGEFFKGGETIDADAPLEHTPVYVKAGSIIPAGPVMQYTSEKAMDPLTLYVYEGADGSFNIYEDEGTTYGYTRKEYTIIPAQYNDSSKQLIIGDRRGEYPGMKSKRSIEVIWVQLDHPVGLGLSAQPKQVVSYEGKSITIDLKK